MQSKDQQRAQKALKHVNAIKDQSFAKTYGQICLKLPAMIQSNGILQTLAFIAARRGSKDYEYLYNHLADQLGYRNGEAMLAELSSADISQYIYSSRELQRCLLWYKRFAASILKVESAGD